LESHHGTERFRPSSEAGSSMNLAEQITSVIWLGALSLHKIEAGPLRGQVRNFGVDGRREQRINIVLPRLC